MSCFCRNVVIPPVTPITLKVPEVPLLGLVHGALAARWLPPPLPLPHWQPDPEWLRIDLPTLPMPAASLGTLHAMVQAHAALLALRIDLTLPGDLLRLGRIVATLNLRGPALRPFILDMGPWLALLRLHMQVEAIQAALDLKLFLPGLPPFLPTGNLVPWRGLLVRVNALMPLLSIAATLKLDIADPAFPIRLAAIIRPLSLLRLPPLADLHLVMSLIARNDAVGRLRLAFGNLPFVEIRLLLLARIRVLLQLLPGLSVQNGQLIGFPFLPPNLGLFLNANMMGQLATLNLSVVAKLNWQVPPIEALAVLGTAQPVGALISAFAAVGLSPIHLSPCDICDAASALAALAD